MLQHSMAIILNFAIDDFLLQLEFVYENNWFKIQEMYNKSRNDHIMTHCTHCCATVGSQQFENYCKYYSYSGIIDTRKYSRDDTRTE